MCGIFALFNKNDLFSQSFIQYQFQKGENRGPEDSKLLTFGDDIKLGFHRLAINGLDDISSQPILIDNIVLICNGEIYNYKQLFEDISVNPKTNSDCEIIIHLYLLFGIEKTLQLLDGVFSFVLYDMSIVENQPNKIFVARDPLGVRPLYILKPSSKIRYTNKDIFYGISSELKVLSEFYQTINSNNDDNEFTLEQFTPGTYSIFEKAFTVSSKWIEVTCNKPYFILNHSSTLLNENQYPDIGWIVEGIQNHLVDAVTKRYLSTERPIACLLSGGLDSSLITALVCEVHKKYSDVPIETYSIGLKDSEDLIFAKKVAEYLGTKHKEIIVTEQEMIDAIPEVIYAIESYDTTTVRASIGNYLLGKYISNNSDAKVIFNGDGSDELCGGYLYMNKSPNSIEFDNETRRLLKDIHLYDVLRSDKCISSHGLEPRTPFLDKSFVNFYLSIPSLVRMHTKWNKCEKYLLRYSFSLVNYNLNGQPKQILPDEILWRKKEAFSDGVSSQGRSLYKIIDEHINYQIQLDLNNYTISLDTNHNIPKTREQIYYRQLFDKYYPNLSHIVPYFWMPKYIEASDPSARTLSIYNS